MRFMVALPVFVGLLVKVFAIPSPDPNIQVVLNIGEDKAKNGEQLDRSGPVGYVCTYDSQCGRGEICDTQKRTCGKPSIFDADYRADDECNEDVPHPTDATYYTISWPTNNAWTNSTEEFKNSTGIAKYKLSDTKCGVSNHWNYTLEVTIDNVLQTGGVTYTWWNGLTTTDGDSLIVITTGDKTECITAPTGGVSITRMRVII